MLVNKVSVLILTLISCSLTEFIVPEATLEAYKPKGFKASIPAIDGIQLFGFHANINKTITQVEPGEINVDVNSVSDNMFTYYDPERQLNEGDVIYFWTFVQFQKLGYRKDNQQWTVTELIDQKATTNCTFSKTLVAGKSQVCQNSLIFSDDFAQTINLHKWTVQQYIPTTPDFEFVSYRKDSRVHFVDDNKLYLKPIAAKTDAEVRKELDLSNGCTSQIEEECFQQYAGSFINPPVTSAKIVSNVNFKYGKIEIKAKLPAGDWIYPQIYLEQVSEPRHKLVIAYSRGNKQLLGNANDDIGSRLLFGGLIDDPQEPGRSKYLKSVGSKEPYSSQVHTFTVNWKQDGINFSVDGKEYGHITQQELLAAKFAESNMAKIVLGVGVGGVNDFPDGYLSGSEQKPWTNWERNQVKKFFAARSKWLNTWAGDDVALQVDSVKVWAL